MERGFFSSRRRYELVVGGRGNEREERERITFNDPLGRIAHQVRAPIAAELGWGGRRPNRAWARYSTLVGS